MDEVFDVWDNGLVTKHERSPEAFMKVMEAKERTGATRVVAVRWSHCGKTHEAAAASELLPDRSGIAVLSDEPITGTSSPRRRLEVLNADSSFRLRIEPPELPGAPMLPSDAATWVGYMANLDGWPEPHFKAALAVEAYYLFRSGNSAFNGWPARVVMEFDWRTGALTQWAHMPERY